MEGEGAADDVVCAWNGYRQYIDMIAMLLSLRERVVPYWGPVLIEGHVLLELLLLESNRPMV